MKKKNEIEKRFKAFDQNLQCRGFQYEVGKTYAHPGNVKLCAAGFHFCEDPLDLFSYYPPAGSRFAEVRAESVSCERKDDSKRVAKSLTVEAEVSLVHLIAAGLKFRLSKHDFSNTPDKATGDSGAASATGEEGCACALGIDGRAMGAIGCWLTVAEWTPGKQGDWHRIDVQTVKVDGETIKTETFYKLEGGKFVEA